MSSNKLALLLALPLAAQTLTTITHDDAAPYLSPIDGLRYYGKIAESTQCRMVRGSVTYGSYKRTFCLGITASDCDVTTPAGIISLTLVPTDAGTTPTGCFYTAAHSPKSNNAYAETWTVPASGTVLRIKDVRTTVTPSPSAIVKLSQIDASAASAGCLYMSGGAVVSTGQACTSATPIPLYNSGSISTSCTTVTAATHGFTAGGLAAWAIDLGTGETLRPAVTINGSNDVTACFATAPAAWKLMIAGSTGSGLAKFTLLSGDQTIAAATHGIYSQTGMGFCYDSSGVEFDCLVTFDPLTFAARIQHSPFSGGSYVVLIGR